jgi:hypothetical protein
MATNMTRVTIDATTMAKLDGLNDLLEICDESGKTLGYFQPIISPPRGPDGKIISPISDEELERRSQHLAGRALKDILSDIQKL